MPESAHEIFAQLKLELNAHYAASRGYARNGNLKRANDELTRAILCLCRAREALTLLGR